MHIRAIPGGESTTMRAGGQSVSHGAYAGVNLQGSKMAIDNGAIHGAAESAP